METKAKQLPTPPWDMENAAQRLQLLENDFNSADPDNVIANFTEDADARFGLAFLSGREEIKQFLTREFATKHNYKLKLDLWGALKGRMAVRSELEWTDNNGLSFKSYGVQVFQFDDDGLIKMNYLSFNDEPIARAM
ncbi:MAG: DUF1348 family protein [Mucilaginibacter sp.]